MQTVLVWDGEEYLLHLITWLYKDFMAIYCIWVWLQPPK